MTKTKTMTPKTKPDAKKTESWRSFHGNKFYSTLLTYPKCPGALADENATYIIKANCTDNQRKPVDKLEKGDVIFPGSKPRLDKDGVVRQRLTTFVTRYFPIRDIRDAFKFIHLTPNRQRDDETHTKGWRIKNADFYEYIHSDRPCKPYFDLEYYVEHRSKESDDIVRTFLAKFITHLKNLINEEIQGKNGYTCRTKSMALTESCGEVKGKYKYSYHVIVRDLLIDSHAHAEELKYRLVKILEGDETIANQEPFIYGEKACIVDDTVYSARHVFRLFACAKACEDDETPRAKLSYSEEEEFVIPYWCKGEVKTVAYIPSALDEKSRLRFYPEPEGYDEAQYLCFLDTIISPGNIGIWKTFTYVSFVFTPDPNRARSGSHKKCDDDDVMKGYNIFKEMYPDWETIITNDEPDSNGRCSSISGRTCPCSGRVHTSSNGYHFDSYISRKGRQYIIRCQSGKCKGYVNGVYNETSASYNGMRNLINTGMEDDEEDDEYEDDESEDEEESGDGGEDGGEQPGDEPRDEEEAEEEERVRRLEKKEAMKAEKIGRVKANYIIFDEDEENPKYIARESYTGFRERVDAPSISDYLTERTEENIEGSSEKSCAKKLALWFCKLARDLSPFYKVSQFGDLMQYKNGEWKDLKATATKYTFLYTVNAKETYSGKVVVTATQILTGSFLNIRPFNKLNNEIIEEAEAEWVRLKTRLPNIQCRYNYFKGQPVPLYNSRCVNVAPGFQAVPIFTGDYSEIEPLIDHIKYSHCAGDETDFDAFMKVKAYPMVNTHDPKSQRCPIIAGVGNCLKTQIWGELMLNVYGIHASASVGVSDIINDKNGILDNKVYLYLDEPATSRGSKDNGLIEVFKRIITAKNINIRKLYNEGKPTSNVANLMVTSNTFDISFVDRKDMRRFLYLKAKVMAMLSNGVRIVATDETYEDVTYMKGGELSAEDKALLIQETEAQDSSIVTRYHNWMLEGLAGGQGHKSQRCADLFAGWLITNYGHIKFKDLPIQSLKAESRKEALNGLTGQVHKFFNALTGEDYNWYSQTKPYLIKSGEKRKGRYHISKSDIYQEFREFRKATSNGHSYDEAHFMTEFYSLVDKTDQIERCYRQWGDEKDNRITVNKKKVAAGFYIAFADGFVIRDDLSPFNSKNRKLPTRNAAANDNGTSKNKKDEDEDNEDEDNEDFSKPKTKTTEPTNTEEEDDPIVTLKASKKSTITEAKKIPSYNIIPADQPDVNTMLEKMQQTFMLQMQKQQEDFMKKLEERDKEHRKEIKKIKSKK